LNNPTTRRKTMLNRVQLMGLLRKDPEMRFLPDGTAVANFSIATDRSWNDETGKKRSETEWHTIVAWAKLGEVCHRYLSKGKLVYVEGRLQTRSWETDGVKHYRTEVVAEQVKFLERKAATDETDLPTHNMPTEDLPF
jgi:single-strand DNA-binding protein